MLEKTIDYWRRIASTFYFMHYNYAYIWTYQSINHITFFGETMNSQYKIKLLPITVSSAGPEIKTTLEQSEKNLGFLPNMYQNMAHAPALLKAYLDGYQLFRNESTFNAMEQEIVFLTISRENGCGYCVAAHSTVADRYANVPVEVTNAIRNDGIISIPRLAALHEFTSIMLVTRGLPSQDDVQAFLGAGYTEQHILEIILAIAVKTMSNYTNHLFHTPLDPAFAERQWEE
ncbi:MAG: carboxymuconolactone decarboxylase family protein [Gammaproteobacteria bacterium]